MRIIDGEEYVRVAPIRTLIGKWREQAALTSDAAFEAEEAEEEERAIVLTAEAEGLIAGAMELEYLLNVEAKQ